MQEQEVQGGQVEPEVKGYAIYREGVNRGLLLAVPFLAVIVVLWIVTLALAWLSWLFALGSVLIALLLAAVAFVVLGDIVDVVYRSVKSQDNDTQVGGIVLGFGSVAFLIGFVLLIAYSSLMGFWHYGMFFVEMAYVAIRVYWLFLKH